MVLSVVFIGLNLNQSSSSVHDIEIQNVYYEKPFCIIAQANLKIITVWLCYLTLNKYGKADIQMCYIRYI